MIGDHFQSVVRLLEVVTTMTETLNNGKKFRIMGRVVSLDVDDFAWELGHDFPLRLLFLQ